MVSLYKIYNSSLELNITLDTDVGAADAGSIKWHVDIGGPGTILPFDVDALVWLQSDSQRRVIA